MPSDLESVRTACRQDVNFFAQNYVYTEDPHAENPVRKWPDYPYLNNCLSVMAGTADTPGLPRIAFKKSRHLLLTWAACVYLLLRCAFEPHRQGMIQSQKEAKSKALIDLRLRFILRELDKRTPWLLPSVPTLTTQSVLFTFPDGSTSKIWSVPQGPDQVASYSPSIVVVDEAALQEHFRSTYFTALPAVRDGGQFIAISSVRYGAWFNKFCKIPGVKTIRVHYTDHPGYKEQAVALGGWGNWKQKMMDEYGEDDESYWDREMEINEDATEGVPAFRPPFDRDTHVASKTIVANPTIPIVRGWDMGFHHPACVWFQVATTGQIVILRELLGSRQELTDFVKEVMTISKEMDPYPTYDSFRDWCDPEAYKKQKSIAGPSEIELLNAKGIYPLNGPKKIAVRPTVRLLKQNLRIFKDRDGDMRPGTLFDPSCTNLIRGFNGAYASKDDESDKFTGGLTQHVIDALRYAEAGEFGFGEVKAA